MILNPKRGVQTACIMAALWLSSSAHAQWDQRSITLNPGWNALYMDLQPEPNDPAMVFAGLPIDSVWTWRQTDTTVQFVQDVSELRPTLPNWMVYIPANLPEGGLTNLFAVLSGHSYLVHVTGSVPAQFNVSGLVENDPIEWAVDSQVLTGLVIDPANPPTFTEYFGASSAHQGQPIFKLKADGLWQQVASPELERIQPDEAYWITTQGTSTYQGPLIAGFSFGPGINFGSTVDSGTLVLNNLSNFDRTVTVSAGPSGSPTSTNSDANLGNVPLGYLRDDLPLVDQVFDPFSAPLTVVVPANSKKGVTVEVRRGEMVDPVLPAGFTEGTYQGLLTITDNAGISITLGVTAEGLSDEIVVAKALSKGLAPPSPRTGLWVGTVQVEAVSQPTADPPILDPVAVTPGHEFQYRVLLHVDTAGLVRLLSQVTMMQHSPLLVQIPDPDNPIPGATAEVIADEQPGYDVAITDDSFFKKVRADDGRLLYTGVDFRGDASVGRRFMSTGFHVFQDDPDNGLKGPGWIRLTGGFPSPVFLDDVFSVTTTDSTGLDLLVVSFDDALNPFKHQFNPSHDNLDAEFLPFAEGRFPASAPGEDVESYTFTRRITLRFTQADPFGFNPPGYGGNVLGGTVEEEISGIFAQETIDPADSNKTIIVPLRLSGRFRIERVSAVPELNDPQANVNDPDAFP